MDYMDENEIRRDYLILSKRSRRRMVKRSEVTYQLQTQQLGFTTKCSMLRSDSIAGSTLDRPLVYRGCTARRVF